MNIVALVCLVLYTYNNSKEREIMNTKTYTAKTYSCDPCNWQVPMIYVRGGLGSYVTNESLRELRKYAEGRDVDEAPVLGNY